MNDKINKIVEVFLWIAGVLTAILFFYIAISLVCSGSKAYAQWDGSGAWGSVARYIEYSDSVRVRGRWYFDDTIQGRITYCDTAEYSLNGSGGGSPAGNNTNIQYNNSGSFGGEDLFVWDYTNKKMGIRNSSPQSPLYIGDNPFSYTLDVNDKVGIVVVNNDTNPALTLLGGVDGAGIIRLGDSDNGIILEIKGDWDSGSYIGTITEDPLQIKTNNTERMVITADGNVGVGTSSPDNTFHVDGLSKFTTGRVLITGTNETGFSGSGVVLSGGIEGLILGYNYNSSTFLPLRLNASEIKFQISGTEKVRVTSTGVGIGTTSPNNPLEVVADAAGSGIRVSGSGTYSPGVRLWNSDSSIFAQNLLVMVSGHGVSTSIAGDYVISINTGQSILFGTSSTAGGTRTEKMRITSDGNVGIGNSSPSYLLDVAGYIHSDSAFVCVSDTGITDTVLIVDSVTGTNYWTRELYFKGGLYIGKSSRTIH